MDYEREIKENLQVTLPANYAIVKPEEYRLDNEEREANQDVKKLASVYAYLRLGEYKLNDPNDPPWLKERK